MLKVLKLAVMISLLTITYFGVAAYAFAQRDTGGPALIIIGIKEMQAEDGAIQYEAFGIILVDWDGRPFRSTMRKLDIVLAFYTWGTIPLDNGIGPAEYENPKAIFWGQFVVDEDGELWIDGPKPRGAAFLGIRPKGRGENIKERVLLYLSGRDRDSESILRARGRMLVGGWGPVVDGYDYGGQPIHRINLNIMFRGRVYEIMEYPEIIRQPEGPRPALGYINALQEGWFYAEPTDQIETFRINLRGISRPGTYMIDDWWIFVLAFPMIGD